MTDIVEQLRNASDGWSGDAFCVSREVAEQAASELTRLRALTEWRDDVVTALKEIERLAINMCQTLNEGEIQAIASKALASLPNPPKGK